MPIHVFQCHKGRLAFSLHQLVNADDVWVSQVAALLHFTSEIIQGSRITGQLRGQSFDSQFVTGLFIDGQPHFAATTTTELLYQLVTAGENL